MLNHPVLAKRKLLHVAIWMKSHPGLRLPFCKVPGNYQTRGCSHRMWTQLSHKLITVGLLRRRRRHGKTQHTHTQDDCVPLWLHWDVFELVVLVPAGARGAGGGGGCWILANFWLVPCETKDKGFLKNDVVYSEVRFIFTSVAKLVLTEGWSPQVMLLWAAVANADRVARRDVSILWKLARCH